MIDPITKTEKFRVWSSFAKNVLEVSKKEVSKKTDLSFSYILKKTGVKYTAIEFIISKKGNDVFDKSNQNQLALDL